MGVVTESLPSDLIERTDSGTNDHVARPKRLTIERVEQAYEAIGCRVSQNNLLVLDGKKPAGIHEAYPLWVVACHETGLEPAWLYEKLSDWRDRQGIVWLSMKLELEADYLRGYTDGYFGQVPYARIDAYRHGWRDGSAHHRHLTKVGF